MPNVEHENYAQTKQVDEDDRKLQGVLSNGWGSFRVESSKRAAATVE